MQNLWGIVVNCGEFCSESFESLHVADTTFQMANLLNISYLSIASTLILVIVSTYIYQDLERRAIRRDIGKAKAKAKARTNTSRAKIL